MRQLRILLVIGLVACGGQTSSTTTPSDTAPGETSTPASATETTATTTETQPDRVPDACGLISAEELSTLLGIDTGEGTTQGTSPDRSICIYPVGVITAIEIAENYEASRDLIENEGRETQDVSGVGNAAFYDEAGQLVALGDRYFVGITAAGDVDVLAQVATRLLEGAGESA